MTDITTGKENNPTQLMVVITRRRHAQITSVHTQCRSIDGRYPLKCSHPSVDEVHTPKYNRQKARNRARRSSRLVYDLHKYSAAARRYKRLASCGKIWWANFLSLLGEYSDSGRVYTGGNGVTLEAFPPLHSSHLFSTRDITAALSLASVWISWLRKINSSNFQGQKLSPINMHNSKSQCLQKREEGYAASSLLSSMGSGERLEKNEEKIQQNRAICFHSFSDLTHVSPAIFVYLLKECYIQGTRKATLKFRMLQQQVLQALYNNPQPGPATFVINCLYLLPLYGPPYAEGFSHLLTSSLRRLQTVQRIPGDTSEAKHLAAQLFLDVLTCSVIHEERILVKLLEIFDLGLKDIAQVIRGSDENHLEIAKAYIEQYIFGLIESQSYMTAVTLLEHFSIRQSGQSFLLRMLQDNQFKAAEKWAMFMGKPMMCVLVQKYLDLKMLKNAYEIIKKNNLRQEFPDAYHLYKESSLKKLAEKGCWDVAEMKTNNDRQLVEYLVYLAMEAGYTEKVDELCERYSLKGFVKVTGPEASPPQTHYLHPTELVIEDIVWVDDVDGLLNATSHIEGYKVVGMDCEWKPNYAKGCKPNKVSIMQIASERTVFILDLIKLSADAPHVLDSCLKRILRSPRILKLGYNLQCDLQQLSHSYGELECFKYYEMLLDIQKLFNETRGGLSGLAKKILGAGLNKTRRNSNWEQRPLSQNQMEYAALDAAVLVHIFHHVRGQPQSTGLKEERAKVEWKSHIVSHMGNTKPPLKASKKRVSEAKPAEVPKV